MEEMTGAIMKEIELRAEKGNTVETIYFGGGTPSILPGNQLAELINAIHCHFEVSPSAEITLEANPDDIEPGKLISWKKAGINRLSLGIQSFDDEELKWMNRAHNSRQAIRSIDHLQQAGFNNISIDLIYGSPLQNEDSLKRFLEMVIQKNIPHLSCYALTVEDKTALYSMIEKGKMANVDPDKQAWLFSLLMNELNAAGYEQYEISNFARPGMRSLHNSNYWKQQPYFGFGPSAHSFDGMIRRSWNVADNALYIQSMKKGERPLEVEDLSIVQQLNEYIMISLRTMEGIDLHKIESGFGNGCAEELKVKTSLWRKRGMLTENESQIILTNEGKLLADGITADLFF